VFDILPLHGVLHPGETQQVQFTFYGHAGVATEVMAACKVEGGPVYQLRLAGEASEVQYKFNTKKIDFGHHVSTCKCIMLVTDIVS
jgi:hydrocephalus-inducing protein